MTIYHRLAFRSAAAVLALSLAGCVQGRLVEPAADSTWRQIGSPAKSTRIYVAPLNPVATTTEQPSEKAPN